MINVPGAPQAVATGINDAGEITGYFFTPRTEIGFIYSGGTYTTLNVPGSLLTVPFGINNAGDIVGLYTPRQRLPAVIVFTHPNYQFHGINDAGEMVGSYAPLQSGFVYSKGTYQYLTVPGAGFTAALGINDQGDVVGFADTTVSLTPEPGTARTVMSVSLPKVIRATAATPPKMSAGIKRASSEESVGH